MREESGVVLLQNPEPSPTFGSCSCGQHSALARRCARTWLKSAMASVFCVRGSSTANASNWPRSMTPRIAQRAQTRHCTGIGSCAAHTCLELGLGRCVQCMSMHLITSKMRLSTADSGTGAERSGRASRYPAQHFAVLAHGYTSLTRFRALLCNCSLVYMKVLSHFSDSAAERDGTILR